ncbi:MAG: heme ABC exporter ATP-binding protein CcmA [Reyranellaceae bacterium]
MAPMPSSPSLTVADLTCRRAGRTVFAGLSFAVAPGELLALVGRNGSGKTTLLRALALLLRPDAGSIRWNDVEVADDAEAWRGRLAWLGHLDGLKGDLTIRENLRVAGRLRSGAVAGDRIEGALATFDLVALGERPVRALSAGLRRRAALARVVLADAPVWLLDEPMNALDAPAQQALRAALAAHLSAGGLAIAATHVELGLPGVRPLALGAAS